MTLGSIKRSSLGAIAAAAVVFASWNLGAWLSGYLLKDSDKAGEWQVNCGLSPDRHFEVIRRVLLSSMEAEVLSTLNTTPVDRLPEFCKSIYSINGPREAPTDSSVYLVASTDDLSNWVGGLNRISKHPYVVENLNQISMRSYKVMAMTPHEVISHIFTMRRGVITSEILYSVSGIPNDPSIKIMQFRVIFSD